MARTIDQIISTMSESDQAEIKHMADQLISDIYAQKKARRRQLMLAPFRITRRILSLIFRF